jgi:hypothetical protein
MWRNRAPGPEIGLPGLILAGCQAGKPKHRPSGRPKAAQRADFEALRTKIRPKSGPEAQCPARTHYCLPYCTTVGQMVQEHPRILKLVSTDLRSLKHYSMLRNTTEGRPRSSTTGDL